MNVIVMQHGNPPSTLTKARVIAPQAAKYLADLFADKTFADSVVVVIDWVGDLFWDQAEAMPEELKTPIMAVICEKRYPMLNNQLLTVDYKLELEDFFGHDNATKDDLHEIVGNMEAKVRAEENRRGI